MLKRLLSRNLSLVARFGTTILPLLVVIVAIGSVIYNDLSQNSKGLMDALKLKQLGSQPLPFLLIQDDATKAMLLDPMLIEDLSMRKIEAYDASVEIFEELRKHTKSEKILGWIDELFELDENHMRPVDSKILELLFEDQEKATKAYFEEYQPLRNRYEEIVKAISNEADERVTAARKDFEEKNASSLRKILLSLFGSFIFISGLLFLNARKVSKTLLSAVQELAKKANQVETEAGIVNHHCTSVLAQSETQLAELNTTVHCATNLEEAARRGKDTSQESQQGAQKCLDLAEKGTNAMNEMLAAMQQLKEGTHRLSEDVLQSNQDFSTTVDKISEIKEKTAFIHDVVFQTKLLSFNASVEAARAGEYGYGFAVVAEEIGKLAAKSGEAAAEISTILDENQNSAQEAVKLSDARIQSSTKETKKFVAQGESSANQCSTIFDLLLNELLEINKLSNGVSKLSDEQRAKIDEISRLIQRSQAMVIETQKATATNASTSKNVIDAQVIPLKSLVQDLRKLITGSTADQTKDDKKKAA